MWLSCICRPALSNWWIRHGRLCFIPRRCQSEGFRPPIFNRIEVSQQAPVVAGYLPDGFSIGGNILRGSIALLPRGYFGWKVLMK